MKIYHNPRCSKSRQTLSLLEENGIKPTIIKYLEETPSKDELKEIIKKLGIKPFDLIRKGESIYKELYKGKEYSDEEWIDIMVKHPKLMERPIVVNGDKAALGRPPVKVLDILS